MSNDVFEWIGGAALVGILLGFFPGAAAAQPRNAEPPFYYVEISALLSVQPDGTVDNHYLVGPLGGTSAGIAGSIGHVFSNGGFVEGSGRFRSPFSDEQIAPYTGLTRFTATHCEIAGDFVVGYSVRASRWLRIDPAGGISMIRGTTVHENITRQPFAPNAVPVPQPDETITNTWVGIAYGGRASFETGSRMAITVGIRGYRILNRDSAPSHTLGLGTQIFDFGAGIAFRF